MNHFIQERHTRPHAARTPIRNSALLALLLCAFLVRGQAADAQTPKSPVLPPSPQSAAPNASVIGKITVIGTHNLSTAFVLSASGHKVGDPCTPETLEEMRKKLFETAYFGGHSKCAEDTVKVAAIPGAAGVCEVTITVDENQLLTGIQITGTGPVKPDTVLSLLHLKPGEVYNDKQLLQDAIAIHEMYLQKGYLAALAPASIDPKGILSITVEVARVSEINVTGSKSINREAILKAMKTKVGDILNIYTVVEDQTHLKQLPALKSRNISITDMGVVHGRVKLFINIGDPTLTPAPSGSSGSTSP